MSQTIPLVDLTAQYHSIQSDIDQAIQRVIDTTSFIMGPDVAKFEDEFAQFCGATNCVGVSSGTSALELTLRAMNVGPDDEVITVAHTFIATVEAISAVGATPVFVDIDSQTYNMDPQKLRDKLTPRTRAIIPVHIYGQPADMTNIDVVLREYAHQNGVDEQKIWVIEDAAQAHGATWQGKLAGTLADAACFSFYPGKNLGAYGDAGAVVTNNRAIADQVRLLRNHGRTEKYLHEQKGYGDRIDTLQAAILRAKLPYLERWTTARRRLAARYDELLTPLALENGTHESSPLDTIESGASLVLPFVAIQAEPAWHLYVVCTPLRDHLRDYLQDNDISVGIHYPVPLHLQPAYQDLNYVKGDFPVTETVSDTCLSLPLYPEMTDAQQDRVVEAIQQFAQTYS
ncbi:DegT/DnrJ/EryC1/StrS family aminotransferase [Chloroflexi bacterium TSY]|nr:DegT/DnrJ/EryC1/StrS family aminotransferase [Chloroflexi bacterium TSY]